MTELATVEAVSIGEERVVRVAGEIDLSNVSEVLDAIADALPADAIAVVVDLSDTRYLDSSAIAMFFRLAERLDHARQQLHLVVPRDAPIRRVLELTNLTNVIPVRDTTT
jgi:anti-anti-sigma factor